MKIYQVCIGTIILIACVWSATAVPSTCTQCSPATYPGSDICPLACHLAFPKDAEWTYPIESSIPASFAYNYQTELKKLENIISMFGIDALANYGIQSTQATHLAAIYTGLHGISVHLRPPLKPDLSEIQSDTNRSTK
jgi:hypothetical protein